MTSSTSETIAALIGAHNSTILNEWVEKQLKVLSRSGTISKNDLQGQCASVLDVFREALNTSGTIDVMAAPWTPVREILAHISRSRAAQGFSPTETAMFIFALKEPLFRCFRREVENLDVVVSMMAVATELLDTLGLYTTDVYQKGREEVIRRQQEDMLELSTPVVRLWDGILALPMIGTLDSARTQIVMETLLDRIVATEADIAIIDITGVPTVDTLTAQHLLKTVTAARLMGADCIISGIRPQIAQTIVHLGVDLGDIVTKATLADAFRVALQRTGSTLARQTARPVLRANASR